MTEEQKQQTRERIGQRVKALRLLADLSQDELAQRAGLQRTHIGRIEGGKYAVTLEVVQAIAEALGMTVDIIDPKLADLAPLKTLTYHIRHHPYKGQSLAKWLLLFLSVNPHRIFNRYKEDSDSSTRI